MKISLFFDTMDMYSITLPDRHSYNFLGNLQVTRTHQNNVAQACFSNRNDFNYCVRVLIPGSSRHVSVSSAHGRDIGVDSGITSQKLCQCVCLVAYDDRVQCLGTYMSGDGL